MGTLKLRANTFHTIEKVLVVRNTAEEFNQNKITRTAFNDYLDQSRATIYFSKHDNSNTIRYIEIVVGRNLWLKD